MSFKYEYESKGGVSTLYPSVDTPIKDGKYVSIANNIKRVIPRDRLLRYIEEAIMFHIRVYDNSMHEKFIMRKGDDLHLMDFTKLHIGLRYY